MRTKAQIVQELLDKSAISAEDAVVLLTNEVRYIQPPPPYDPYKIIGPGTGGYPFNPLQPPYTVTCKSNIN